MNINEINTLDQAGFVQYLGGVFEHSPWIAEQTWAARPFADREALHKAMLNTLRRADEQTQLALIQAHPELAGKAAEEGSLTHESTVEQASAGLNQCTPAELAEIRELNRAYSDKFGFPFIMAVKGRSKTEILQAFRQRLNNTHAEEVEQALAQIGRITWLRLNDLIEE